MHANNEAPSEYPIERRDMRGCADFHKRFTDSVETSGSSDTVPPMHVYDENAT